MTAEFGKEEVGSSFDDFLKEQGIYEEVTESAIKSVLALQLAEIMEEQNIGHLDRLLDPDNDGVTLGTLSRTANLLGHSLKFELRKA